MDPSSYRLLYLSAQAAQDQAFMVISLLAWLVSAAWLVSDAVPAPRRLVARSVWLFFVLALGTLVVLLSNGGAK